MARPLTGLLVLALAALPGCDEEPLDLSPRGEDGGGGAGGGSAGARDGGPGGGGGPPRVVDDAGRPVEIRIDEAVFRAVILPILDRRCSTPTCHGLTPRADGRLQLYLSPEHPVDRQTDTEVDTNLGEVSRFVDWLSPGRSELLSWPLSQQGAEPNHPTPSPVLLDGGEEHLAILDWIRAATAPEEPDAGPPDAGTGEDAGGGPRIPCAAMPNPHTSRYLYERFVQEVNPMLTETCTGSECHGVAGFAGGLWLQDPETECQMRWNFFAVQWFVDPVRPVDSPLLQKPLDRNHGGREVFRGMSDARFGLLKRWIEDSLMPR